MTVAVFNGLHLLGVVALLAIVVLVFYAVLCDFDRWLNYKDPFSRQLDEIRGLPEAPDAPFDWELEDAA